MSSFRLEITTNNAAFGDHTVNEVARILRVTADKLEDGELPAPADFRRRTTDALTLLDVNGNSVGRATFR